MAIYAVDFDGTLSFGNFPECGKPNMRLINWLKERKAEGNKLILWTCRHDEPLEKAVKWCECYGLTFDAVNENLPEMIEKYGESRKIGADYYIDDSHFTSGYLMKKKTVQEAKIPTVATAFIARKR